MAPRNLVEDHVWHQKYSQQRKRKKKVTRKEKGRKFGNEISWYSRNSNPRPFISESMIPTAEPHIQQEDHRSHTPRCLVSRSHPDPLPNATWKKPERLVQGSNFRISASCFPAWPLSNATEYMVVPPRIHLCNILDEPSEPHTVILLCMHTHGVIRNTKMCSHCSLSKTSHCSCSCLLLPWIFLSVLEVYWTVYLSFINYLCDWPEWN